VDMGGLEKGGWRKGGWEQCIGRGGVSRHDRRSILS